MTALRIAALALALAVPGTAPAGAAAPATAGLPATLGIPPFRMEYRVLHGNWGIGTATFTLNRRGNAWVFQWEAHPTGLAALFVHSTYRERSRFLVAGHILRPLAYAYSDSGHADRDEAIRFDWDAGRALDINDDRKKEFELAPGMLDRLSSQLAMSRRLAAGLPMPTTYRVINGGRVRTYKVKELRRETIRTPAGKFDTIVVERSETGSNKTFVFWLAPKYAWLPVRFEQREPGTTTDTSVLTGLTWLPTTPPASATD